MRGTRGAPGSPHQVTTDVDDEADEIVIGVSSCLLGNNVRYDGGHKRDGFVNDILGKHVRFVAVCPEMEIGLGAPRETLRLVRGSAGPHMVGNKSGADHTRAMQRFARQKVSELRRASLSGFILKRGSPSCGLHRVRVYGAGGVPADNGRGLFAAALSEGMPLLPTEEEGRLHDVAVRESFCERVFFCHRLTSLLSGRWRYGDLVAFHTREKMLLLAHDPPAYRTLGKLVARGKDLSRAELASSYAAGAMGALSKLATARKHTNVLQHMAGHFKRLLGDAERAHLHEVITDYHQGQVPLVVPVTLVKHFARVHKVQYLLGQSYLEPHPKELMLRNHA